MDGRWGHLGFWAGVEVRGGGQNDVWANGLELGTQAETLARLHV